MPITQGSSGAARLAHVLGIGGAASSDSRTSTGRGFVALLTRSWVEPSVRNLGGLRPPGAFGASRGAQRRVFPRGSQSA